MSKLDYVIGTIGAIIGACYYWAGLRTGDTAMQIISTTLMFVGVFIIILEYNMEKRRRTEESAELEKNGYTSL